MLRLQSLRCPCYWTSWSKRSRPSNDKITFRVYRISYSVLRSRVLFLLLEITLLLSHVTSCSHLIGPGSLFPRATSTIHVSQSTTAKDMKPTSALREADMFAKGRRAFSSFTICASCVFSYAICPQEMSISRRHPSQRFRVWAPRKIQVLARVHGLEVLFLVQKGWWNKIEKVLHLFSKEGLVRNTYLPANASDCRLQVWCHAEATFGGVQQSAS